MTEWDAERIRAIWNRLADAWDRNRDLIWSFTKPISEHLVQRLDPKPGETILEVGAGTGETGFLVAALIGPSGRLIATDFSPEMLARARAGAERAGLSNLDLRLMDVMNLDLPDASVDGIVGRLVYHLVPDPRRALAEARRVLRDGGRLCFTVFGPEDEVPYDLAVMTTMVKRELRMPPGITIDVEMNDEDLVREVTEAAGFRSVDVERVGFRFRFPDDDAAWRYLTELYGRAADLIRGLPADQQRGFREDFLAELEPYRTDGGRFDIPAIVLNVHARV